MQFDNHKFAGLRRSRDKGIQTSVAIRAAAAAERAALTVPVIREVQAAGAVSLNEIAGALNARGIPTARGRSWSAVQVRRVLQRA
ncbi:MULTISPECIES: recombinase family protein [unclassified Methylobacterium]|uniref:recombinase family protein n=1 Tax=unclassified Methylobacterium TaxID=2615210 RepID=UPI000152C16E|nr:MULTISPECIES: recombinase family protein [Methylobacterium]WFT81006.1 recombinase family protein [Methylobacterium nodulans]